MSDLIKAFFAFWLTCFVFAMLKRWFIGTRMTLGTLWDNRDRPDYRSAQGEKEGRE